MVAGRRVGNETLNSREVVAYWFNMGNVVPTLRGETPGGWLDVSWSLATEEQFYLIWPAIVVLCSRRNAMRVAAGMIVAAPLFRTALAGLGTAPMAVYVMTPGRIDALAAGAWVALAARGPGGLATLRPAAGRLAVGAGLGLIGLMISLAVTRRCFYPFEFPMQSVGHSLLAAFFAGGLVLLVTAPPDAWGAAPLQ
jgi:peptidoglycan/LPS O-acetylase OafA/YrhL